MFADQFDDDFVADLAGAEGIDHQGHRPGNADRVGDLYFAALGETGWGRASGQVFPFAYSTALANGCYSCGAPGGDSRFGLGGCGQRSAKALIFRPTN